MKKGFVQGLCQIFSNVAIGAVFTVALWYGQTLIKTECETYSAGKLVVVSILSHRLLSMTDLFKDLHCLSEYNMVSESNRTQS